jgi:hypothetical protein
MRLPGPQFDAIHEALAAVERRDWEGLKPLLHPYLHWTTKGGAMLRGRQQVMARLVADPPSGPPSTCDLRDGQIYRWVEGNRPH